MVVSIALAGTIRVKRIAQAITEQVIRQDREQNKRNSPKFPRGVMDGTDTRGILQQRTPTGQRWTNTQTQPAESRLCQDHARDRQRGDHDDMTHRAWEQMTEHDAPIRSSSALGRQYIFTFTRGQD